MNQSDIEDVTERESSGGSSTELGGFDSDGFFNDFEQAYWYPEFIERTGNMTKIVEEYLLKISKVISINFKEL